MPACNILGADTRRAEGQQEPNFGLGRAFFGGQCREILLAGLERYSILAGGAFKVHTEPDREKENAAHALNYVLGNFPTLLVSKSLNLKIIRLDLRPLSVNIATNCRI